MGNYRHSHIRALTQAARERFDRLMRALEPHAAIHDEDGEIVGINGCAVRIAVDDFATILKEIRRLK